jgi:hypothetical protein
MFLVGVERAGGADAPSPEYKVKEKHGMTEVKVQVKDKRDKLDKREAKHGRW